jgi:hypothetical protein
VPSRFTRIAADSDGLTALRKDLLCGAFAVSVPNQKSHVHVFELINIIHTPYLYGVEVSRSLSLDQCCRMERRIALATTAATASLWAIAATLLVWVFLH